jgi:hypothetical protein
LQLTGFNTVLKHGAELAGYINDSCVCVRVRACVMPFNGFNLNPKTFIEFIAVMFYRNV